MHETTTFIPTYLDDRGVPHVRASVYCIDDEKRFLFGLNYAWASEPTKPTCT